MHRRIIVRHVAALLTSAPSIFATGCTVVLPPERPELRGDSASTSAGLVCSLLTAPEIATAAFVRIWRFIHPREFGSDVVNVTGARHRS
jgi:hypothetical protein